MRCGTGWDSHRIIKGRALMLGGVQIPSTFGELGHSDGDVLLHAIIDAMFGAVALGDIGQHYPPTDETFKDISSSVLLKRTKKILEEAGYHIISIDSTVILEQPKLSGYIMEIRTRIAKTLALDIEAVSVKAKSAEGLGPVGEGKSIEAMAIVVVEPIAEEIWL